MTTMAEDIQAPRCEVNENITKFLNKVKAFAWIKQNCSPKSRVGMRIGLLTRLWM